jgi:hypothetical protein
MLMGFEHFRGRQAFGASYTDGFERVNPDEATHACVMGAAIFAEPGADVGAWNAAFAKVWGDYPACFNDDEKLPWEHIYGMAKAAGL